MALVVNITGGENIEQGDQVTLNATVEDANGNTPPGTLQYAWSASRGSFIGETDASTAVYHADFTDTGDVPVTITCDVTRPANVNPTSSGPSLTALAEIGVTGILVNMFLTALGGVASNTNNVLYNASTGTLDAGSDQRLASNINVYQLRWDNTNNNFVLNNNEGGNIGTFFTGNNNQSVYIIFADGTYEELTPADFAAGTSRGQTWARWLVTDTNILALLNGLSTTDDLVVGVADTGSIGWGADAGSDTETFTASVPLPLGIETIDEQFIALGTKDYDLVIDIGGNPDSATARGLTEGFDQHWDADNNQLHIVTVEATRLINGVVWDIEAVKGPKKLESQIKYNVVKPAPIFQELPTIHLYRGVPINFDILIVNIPDLINPQTLLISLKSELQEYGLNFQGFIPSESNYAVTDDTLQIIVLSETGGTPDMHNYPYRIEATAPPPMTTPVFNPKGNYGELVVSDVQNALGYQWTLDGRDAEPEAWNFFSDARPVINPSQIEVTPGNLEVTIKFPNIAGASSYAYMLESETHEVDWTRFMGTLANGFITTIIPNLEDGVEYTLWLRVGSPWVGPPVSITVYGGRVIHGLNFESTGSSIIVFHTGVRENGIAQRIKTINLPTSLNNVLGLAVSGTTAYVANAKQTSSGQIHVFDIDVNDGEEANQLRVFNDPSEVTFTARYLTIIDETIYCAHAGNPVSRIYSFSAKTSNNATATLIASYSLGGITGLDAKEDLFIYLAGTGYNFLDVPPVNRAKAFTGPEGIGLTFVGDFIYSTSESKIYIVPITSSGRLTAEDYKTISIPLGASGNSIRDMSISA